MIEFAPGVFARLGEVYRDAAGHGWTMTELGWLRGFACKCQRPAELAARKAKPKSPARYPYRRTWGE